MTRKGPITAAELTVELQADPAYVKMRAEKDAERAAKEARFRAEETPLLADLKQAGYNVGSVWDLVNTSTPYPAAIPVLLSHLEKPYSDRILEGIARSLAVSDAKSAWPILMSAYKTSPQGSDVKSGLAVALAATSSEDVIDQLALAARDVVNGNSRLLLLSGLKRSRSLVAQQALSDLRNDPVLAKEIASWRKPKLKARKTVE